MLSLLKKLWNWLKSLFIASPKAINPKKVENTPPEPSDGEYEGILMGLFEQVAAGTTTGGLRGWLYSRHCDDKKLARWLEVKSEEWLRYPEDYQTLGRNLAALGKVMTGNLGEVSQRISLQLRDAVRDVSGVEEENLDSKETDLTEVVQDVAFWFEQGYQKYMNGDFIGAIASWDRALEIKPDNHEAWNSRGVTLNNLGRYEEALASSDKALEIKPDFYHAWYVRGFALNGLGRFEQAIASCDQALEMKPDYPDAWSSRGIALYNLGRFEQAIASYDRALEIKPDFHLAWTNRGIALDDLGRFEEAIASYDRALEIKPDFHEAWYNRGIALDNLGRFEDAIASYDRALEIKPDFHEAWYNRGIALDNLG
ncbi:tetratricopeptide repeat protein, partial [Microcystis aeruginosa]|uniref:tetratricopeptide repeat protein n=1 Tax=Microcystis aeruginosa TaxID=1126 RepID=UPI00232FBD24